MTVREAAARLELSPCSLYGMLADGTIPCHRVGRKGGKIVIDEADLDAYWASTRRCGPARGRAGRPVLKHFTSQG